VNKLHLRLGVYFDCKKIALRGDPTAVRVEFDKGASAGDFVSAVTDHAAKIEVGYCCRETNATISRKYSNAISDSASERDRGTMSTLLRDNIIPFPSNDLAPPRAISTREIAQMLIADWRRRRTQQEPLEIKSDAVEAENRSCGQQTPPIASSSEFQTDVCGSPSESFDWRQYRAVIEARQRTL